jgi:hypothetical protein
MDRWVSWYHFYLGRVPSYYPNEVAFPTSNKIKTSGHGGSGHAISATTKIWPDFVATADTEKL